MDVPVGLLCPYITYYTDPTRLQVNFVCLGNEYQLFSARWCAPLVRMTLVFEDSPNQIVVKFAQSYHAGSHRLLAGHNVAPELLYDGTAHPSDQPGPDHSMIVVEYIEDVGS
ncbi:unnamed protein product [Rhizoctonia solani]|uniref:Uncharacterized protein n=1 Tax=Rhizoctonia solani TaxID=456999 RepID=A0A8H3GAQ7_9AGAM|nr:unnamed protein product [Rhizoctonia solani]